MRRYETIIITDPDLSAEQREPILKRVQDVISQENGYLALTDDWGNRKLAYEIKKRPRGYYTRFDFCGTAAAVDEIERFFRIDDRVLKYMTVLLDKTADIEKIKEEIASTQKTVEAPSKEAPPKTDTEAPPKTDTPAETQVPEEKTDTAESTAPEAPLASVEDQTPTSEEPVDAGPSQTPEPEAGESEATPTETKEEIK
ncbi:MAG: 30S ribosomal protein S6 [Deltaproteobacteria bacterium]|nr:30S ribosomal protein S6 [Deltaproteobacteria bacterium]